MDSLAREHASICGTCSRTAWDSVAAAVVQTVDDAAHAAYKEGISDGCSVAGECAVSFSTVPADHRRIDEHLSCSVYVPSPVALRFVAFLANSFSLPRDFMP